jgi:hypothetical protein
MTGGSEVIGLWRNREAVDESMLSSEEPLVSAVPDQYDYDEGDVERPARAWRRTLATTLCAGTALSWIGLLGYQRFFAPSSPAPSLDSAVAFVTTVSAPLALIGVGWLLMMRSSRSEAKRFAETAEGLQAEQGRLESALGRINDEINASRERLAEQAMQLISLGDGASSRINLMTRAMENEIETLGRQAETLKTSASGARSDIAVLLASLPKAQIQARQMVVALQDAATTAHERAGALDAQLSLLTARGREADEIAGGAAQKLAAHLSRVEGVSETAGTRLEEAAGQMTTAVDSALERASEALNSARSGMEAQAAAMLAMVEQSQAATAQAGAESSEMLNAKLAAIATQAAAISTALEGQHGSAARLQERLSEDIDSVERRLAELEVNGVKRSEKLAASIGSLRDNADSLKQTLDGGGESAKLLIDRSETLLTALDAAAREIDETLPAAYARLETQAASTLEMVSKASPQVLETAKVAEDAATKLTEAEATMTRHRETIEGLSSATNKQLSDSLAATEALAKSVAEVESQVAHMSASAGPQLVEALVRVRETATQAAEHAKVTLGDVIPRSAEALGRHSKEALSAALTEQVGAQMVEIARTTELAVSAAQKATDRLMRQMLTISETSAALETRISEARQEVEAGDQANFSRRVALLIESLNSTAIDVTKVLSNEVTDSAWAAYLRGDRGVFVRRAVRLLDAGEQKEIVRHYEEEPEFREHVNRYIHDFEAMLRNVLATRDGSPLGVTLLSSDNGKLYVALAQAIERLRA